MHLVGLIVAGERVHHQVDAKAKSHLALQVAARLNREQGPPRRVTAQAAAQSWRPTTTGETISRSAPTHTRPPRKRPGRPDNR